LTQIVCSPFIRAQQTAEIIAGELGIPVKNIIVINDLHERRMGVLEDKPKLHPTDYYYHIDSEHGFETHQQVIDRVNQALSKIIEIAKKLMERRW
jgi:broad specificity phosphatase PhoE